MPGPAGSEWNNLRFEGFKEAAAKCNLNLVGNTYRRQYLPRRRTAASWRLLLKNPDADYIYAVAGIFAVGAAQQVKRMNPMRRW